MADIPPPVYLLLLFVLFRVVGGLRKLGKPAPPGADERRGGADRPRRLPAPAPRSTQQEALALEQLLRGQLARRTQVETESYGAREMEPEVASLETVTVRRERAVIDQDDEGEAIARRRIAEAARRDAPLASADHAAFHRRIATAPAVEAAATDELSPARLRELRRAIVMAEVLGPPVALRSE